MTGGLHRAAGLLFLASLSASQGCTEPRERNSVSVSIDAARAVRAKVTQLEVSVGAEDSPGAGYETLEMRSFTPNAGYEWPIEFRVKGRAEAGVKYQLTATARNPAYAVVAQARVITKLRTGQNLVLRAHFDADCLNPTELCLPGTTCRGGKCVSAEGDPYRGVPGAPTEEPAADGGSSPADGEQGAVSSTGARCTTPDALSCAGHDTRSPLRCTESVWVAEPECSANERCDTREGPDQGTCRPIARECMNRTPDVPFCTSDQTMLVCTDLLSARAIPCNARERCVTKNDHAVCDCESGYVKATQGGCVEAKSCDVDNGGCDPLTKCTAANSSRECSACPPGFTGEGETGCSPLLAALEPSAGKLVPAFAPSTFDYQIQVPMMVQRLGLTATAPSDAKLVLDGSEIASGALGMTRALPLGMSVSELVVTTDGGKPTPYRITIERTAVQEAYLKSPAPGNTEHFGYRMAADGDTLVVGAPWEDGGSSGVNGNPNDDSIQNSGAAYVFVRQNGEWSQQAYLKPNDPAQTSFFGVSVAISGDTIVVGCIEDDVYDPTKSPTRPGAAYVFTRQNGSWTQQQKLTAKDGQPGDWFGLSVGVDGDTAVIGASHGDATVMDSGAVYVFGRSGVAWTEIAKLGAMMPTRNSEFGSEVRISGDWFVVGAQEEDIDESRSGGAYLFQRSGSTWVARQRLTPPQPIRDGTFGVGLALDGDRLAVSAPRWEFAASLFVKRPPGEVYLFERGQDDRWSQTSMLRAIRPVPGDYFGVSLAMVGDALFVGSNGEGSGGRGVGADPAAGSSDYSGAAYLYVRVGRDWMPSGFFKASNRDDKDGFGYSVALSADTAFAAAVYENSNASGIDGDASNNSLMSAGAVYAFH
jgi:FG-GAP repeat/Cadherin-like beta sandwich domain